MRKNWRSDDTNWRWCEAESFEPVAPTEDGDDSKSGIQMRDYMAARALPALIEMMYTDGADGGFRFYDDAAKAAYRIADSMVAASMGIFGDLRE
jgi:hypothetical protein